MGKYDDLFESKYRGKTSNQNSYKNVDTKSYSNKDYDKMFEEKYSGKTALKPINERLPYDKNKYIENKNLETITDLQNNLLDNGVNIDNHGALSKDNPKGWLATYIFDPLSAGQYALAKGTKNVIDKDDNTTFLGGLKDGFLSGFNASGSRADDRTSWEDTLKEALDSDNKYARGLGSYIANSTVSKDTMKHPIKSLLNANIVSQILSVKDKINDVERAKQNTKVPGLLGDIFLDPMNYIDGVADAAKVIGKGSGVLKSADKIGDVGKATDIINTLYKGEEAVQNAKMGQELFDKTSKALGYMNDYKGITLGTDKHHLTLMKPETLGKLGDELTKMGANIFKPIADSSDFIKGTEIFKNLKEKLGGEFGTAKRFAKENPKQALETYATIDFTKRIKNRKTAKLFERVETVQDIQKIFKDRPELENIIANTLEKEGVYETIKTIEKLPNEERVKKIKEVREALVDSLKKEKERLAEITKNVKDGDLVGKINATKTQAIINDYDDIASMISKLSDEEYAKLNGITIGEAKQHKKNMARIIEEETLNAERTIGDVSKSIPEKQVASDVVKKNKVSAKENIQKRLEEAKKEIGDTNIFDDNPLEKIVKETKEEAKTPVKKIAEEVKVSSLDEQIHELDRQLGRKETKFIEGVTEEQKKIVLKNRQKELNKIEDVKGIVPKDKKSLEETYKELNNKKLTDLSDETYNKMLDLHNELKLPLDDEIKNRYKSMNEWEAKEEIDFLNRKFSNRRKLNEEHTVVNKLGKEKKVVGSVDYISELSNKTKTKPRFNIESEDFFENNIGFRNIEKARLERKLNRKAIQESGEITESMTIQLTDALASTFKDTKWIQEAGDDITRDIKYLSKREYDSVWDTIKKARNKPKESMKNIDNWRTTNKAFTNDIKNSIKEADELTGVVGKNRDAWINDRNVNRAGEVIKPQSDYEHIKNLIKTNSNELNNVSEGMVHGIIERDLSRLDEIPDLKELKKEFADARKRALPMTEKQTEAVKNTLSGIRTSRPDIYEIVKEEFKSERHTLKISSREQVNKFFNRVNELTGSVEFASGKLSEKASKQYADKLTNKAKALYSKGKSESNKELMEIANIAQDYLKEKGIKSYVNYSDLNTRLQKYFDKDVKNIVAGKVDDIAKIKKSKEIKNVLTETITTTPKKELLKQAKTVEEKEVISQLKDAYDTMAAVTLDEEPVERVIKEKIKNLESLLNDNKKFMDNFERKYGKDYPMYVERVKESKKLIKDSIDDLDSTARGIAESIREDFKKMGIEEGLITKEQADDVYNYVTHVLNPEYRNTELPVEIANSLKNPTNKHAKTRTLAQKLGVEDTIEAINKAMEEKHGISNFLEDRISKIYIERALAHDKYMFDKDQVDKFMSTFGKRIDKEAYVGLSKEGKKALFDDIQAKINSGKYSFIKLDDEFLKSNVFGLSDEALEAYKKAFNEGQPFTEIPLNKLEDMEVYLKNKQPVYLVDKKSHKLYLDVFKGQFKENLDPLLQAYDRAMSIWRAQALSTTSFHVNNFMGNNFNNFLGMGANVLDPEIGFKSIQLRMGKGKYLGKSADEWDKIFKEFGVMSNNMIDDIGITNKTVKDFRDGKIDNLLNNKSPLKKIASAVNPASKDFAIYKVGGSVGNAIENQARVSNFLYHVREGMSYQGAADMVNKYLFDYSDLSSFESGTLKRIFPFYTWMRKNVPLQLEHMFTNPGKYSMINKSLKKFSKKETDEEVALRPDYLDGAIYKGDGKYRNLNLPYNDLAKLDPRNAKDTLGSTNPLIKLAIEMFGNKQIFNNAPIEYFKGETEEAPSYLKWMAEDTPKGKMTSKKLNYIVENLLPMAKNAETVYKYAKGTATQAEKDRAIGILTGNREYNVDFEKQRSFAIKDYIERLEELEQKAKKEGKLSKTAEQIRKEKENQKQYDKITEIYNKNREYVDNIYKNNYVIPKKKKKKK